ncbi:MAG: ring-cleaving dioxygenase [Fimbriimonadaceae bacterium]
MALRVHGIHHVTAITADISRNLEFYTGTLGLRLVKKSINQDDVSAYHLFYADKVASPGTDLTYFDWPASAANRPGAGTVAITILRVAGHEALNWWEARLEAAGCQPERDEDISGRELLSFSDPEGQCLALIDDSGLPSESVPWDPVVPAEYATRGFFGIDIASSRPDGTKWTLDLLGFKPTRNPDVYEVSTPAGHAQISLVEDQSGRRGQPGAGGIHHVAFRVADDDELTAYQQFLESKGFSTSGFVDRFYFHSLYFREPGGVLFELATDGPGMDRDELPSQLGEHLSIPPFLESRRGEIEAGLKPLPAPDYAAK